MAGAAVTKAARGDVYPTFDFESRVITDEGSDRLAVRIDDTEIRTPALTTAWPCPTGVWVLGLTRTGALPKSSNTYPLCSRSDVDALAAALRSPALTDLEVVVNSLNRATGGPALTLTGLTTALGQVGVAAATFATLNLSTTAFSVWGVPKMSAGQAFTSFAPLADEAKVEVGKASPASLTCDLVQDTNGKFALERTDYVTYDVAADGTITVGAAVNPADSPQKPIGAGVRTFRVPAQPAGFTGGFHLLVLDARSLEVVEDTLYPTNGDPAGVYRFGRRMQQLAAEPTGSVLVFLASVGDAAEQVPAGPIELPANCIASAAFTVNCTFGPTDGEQKFTVPGSVGSARVDSLHVVATGGHGGQAKLGGAGGRGSVATADIPVDGATLKAGQTLYVEVGGNGSDGGSFNGGAGGFNGGASGGGSAGAKGGWPGGGGGGASDIRTQTRYGDSDPAVPARTRLVVAAGGGGAGGEGHDCGRCAGGGQGGGNGFPGLVGDAKVPGGGGGGAGTATAGGSAGSGGKPGAPGSLQRGGAVSGITGQGGAAGGGGGGWYGG
ncbi:MAG: hypothetical protein ACR2P2_03445, partial [Nakamurella sp.]